MSGSVFFVTTERSEVIDYSTPVFFEEHRIVYKRPKIEANLAGFVKPFNFNVRDINLLC